MYTRLILTLLNIPRVSRKTIKYLLDIKIATDVNVDEIKFMFTEGRNFSKKIPLPNEVDIECAINKASEIISLSEQNGIGAVTVLDSSFPVRLKEIKDPPVIIFYKGNINCILEEKSIAIIGTRTPTSHGQKIAERLGYLFGEDDFVVTSGLAKGCDEFAHKGCVNSNGRSIAVLPCGLDYIYPASNKLLANLIIENNGCLISEYSIGTKPYKSYFIERDRLQSALSQAVIVIETDIKGGTMHTVGYTLEQNRILACYNHDDSYKSDIRTHGNIKLISEGKAIPISSADDIKNLKNMILNRISSEHRDTSISNTIKATQISLF